MTPFPKFDLVIIDEAHHIKNPNTYAYQAAQMFCDNAESIVLLTATINLTRRRDIGNFTLRKPETLKVSFTPEQQECFDRQDSDLYNELYFDDSPYWRKNANLISNILKEYWQRKDLHYNSGVGYNYYE